MSDTIQGVTWSLEGEPIREGWLSPPIGRHSADALLWQSIHRLGIEAELRAHFRVAERVWHCLWIDSPLTREQCLVLRALFKDVAVTARRWRDVVQPFLTALDAVAEASNALNVKLAPPGHVDMGWITTFVHCPRCKAEGPFSRWQPSYPVEPVVCDVCGNSYSPAATYVSEREYFANEIACAGCGMRHRVKDFQTHEIEILENQHYFHSFCEELVWLRRVAAFYQRHPERRRREKPHSTTPANAVGQQAHDAPYIEAPLEKSAPVESAHDAVSADWSAEDDEVMAYLRRNLFSLEPRWRFVTQSVERLRPIVEQAHVACPTCGRTLLSAINGNQPRP